MKERYFHIISIFTINLHVWELIYILFDVIFGEVYDVIILLYICIDNHKFYTHLCILYDFMSILLQDEVCNMYKTANLINLSNNITHLIKKRKKEKKNWKWNKYLMVCNASPIIKLSCIWIEWFDLRNFKWLILWIDFKSIHKSFKSKQADQWICYYKFEFFFRNLSIQIQPNITAN